MRGLRDEAGGLEIAADTGDPGDPQAGQMRFDFGE